jgi:hypothetical protein
MSRVQLAQQRQAVRKRWCENETIHLTAGSQGEDFSVGRATPDKAATSSMVGRRLGKD